MEEVQGKKVVRGNIQSELKEIGKSALEDDELESVSVFKLMRAFEKVLERFEEDQRRKAIHRIIQFDYEVGDEQDSIRSLILKESKVSFEKAFEEIVESMEKEVEIEVRDNGFGIATEQLNRIFERFYRINRQQSKKMGGTGLGLSIVKHIALAHNGRVDVSSSPGDGSSFRIYLPIQPV